MTAAAPSLPSPTHRPSSLPRLNRVLSAAARAALAARRAGLSHAPETRAKISSTARRNRARRVDAAVAMAGVLAVEAARDAADEAAKDGSEGKGGEKEGGRKVQSAEHRENIGAALRGRRLSKAHREKLSARFSGENNPMYGRKLSKESRAKISESLRRARAEKEEKPERGTGEDEKKKLSRRDRREVMESRLVTSMRKNALSEAEITEEAVLDALLQRVASGECPPTAVKRVLEDARRKAESVEAERQEESDVFVTAAEVAAEAEEEEVKTVVPVAAPVAAPRPGKLKSGRKVSGKTNLRVGAVTCGTCEGSGSVVCMKCVGQVGLASRHCEACSGAAVTFCPTCLGAGESAE